MGHRVVGVVHHRLWVHTTTLHLCWIDTLCLRGGEESALLLVLGILAVQFLKREDNGAVVLSEQVCDGLETILVGNGVG